MKDIFCIDIIQAVMFNWLCQGKIYDMINRN